MKTTKLGIILGAMILNLSAVAQEVKPTLAIDLSKRINTGKGTGFLFGLRTSIGSNPMVDASFLFRPTDSPLIFSEDINHSNGNTAISLVGFGGITQSQSGYLAASISPIMNLYLDKVHGVFVMPLSAQASFQKSISDWLEIEGNVNGQIIAVWQQFQGERAITLFQGSARLQSNVKLGEGISISPFLVYNSRTGGTNKTFVGNKLETREFDQYKTINAGLALKAAM